MTGGELHWAARTCSAEAALATLTGTHTVLVATPTEHVVALLEGGVLRVPDASPWPLPQRCFQLTAFDGRSELRWLADGESGRAVWLADNPAALPVAATGDPATGNPVQFARTLPQLAVLWGEPAPGDAAGFSAWSEARVGLAYYPCPPGVARRDRAVLESVEYVAHDEHGNAAVVERRLVAIRTVNLRDAAVRS